MLTIQKMPLLVAALGLVASTCNPAEAADLRVSVNGIKNSKGSIGCALFRTADGFPNGSLAAVRQSHPASTDGVACSFTELEPGIYAVSVLHDSNGNKKLDTGFFGIPREDWGVSNNVRPRRRAPTFEEAQFELNESKALVVRLD